MGTKQQKEGGNKLEIEKWLGDGSGLVGWGRKSGSKERKGDGEGMKNL